MGWEGKRTVKNSGALMGHDLDIRGREILSMNLMNIYLDSLFGCLMSPVGTKSSPNNFFLLPVSFNSLHHFPLSFTSSTFSLYTHGNIIIILKHLRGFWKYDEMV